MFENERYGLSELREEAKRTANELARLARLKIKLGMAVDLDLHPVQVDTDGVAKKRSPMKTLDESKDGE